MERCKTCKHWSRMTSSTWGRGGWCQAIGGGNMVGFMNGGLAGLQMAPSVPAGYQQLQLVTHEEFGCVHWEEKPKEKA